MGFFSPNQYPPGVFLLNAVPLVICGAMAVCMHKGRYKGAMFISFVFFPPTLLLMKLATDNQGVQMYLVLYLLFAFFFLHRHAQIISALAWILGCWVAAQTLTPAPGMGLFGKAYPLDLGLAVINYATAFLLIILTLYVIKFGVWRYEQSLRNKKEELKRLNTLKDKVFSVISHDLRTPVASIILLLQAMETDDFTEAEFKDLLPELRENMEETGELLTNLLAWARSQMQQTEYNATAVSLADLTRQTLRFLNRHGEAKKIRLLNHVPQHCTAFADKQSLEIVLRNLVANAIKFTPSGGYVKVSSRIEKDCLCVSVEDNGIGIPEEKQALLFSDSFYTSTGTANEKGTGLGLLICRDILQKNGGEINFASQKGEGTTFTFSVPA